MKNNKAALVTFTVVAVLFVLGVFWLRAVNSGPPIVIPNPTLPSPNAFDFYVKAGNAIVDENKVDFAISTRHSVSRTEPDDHAYSLAEKDALVAENARALGLLRRGFAYPYLNPSARSFSALFPYFAKFRGTARLLTLEGQARRGHGDWGGAVSCNLDAVRLGVDVPHGSVLIGDLTGIACQAVGRRPAWDAVGHLSAPQARAAARRMEDIEARQLSYADTLQEEKWCTQAGLQQMMRAPNWRQGMAQGFSVSGSANWGMNVRMLFVSKGQILRNYTRFMDQSIANARLPYAAHPPAPAIPSDPINQMLLPVFEKAGFKNTDTETENALLTTLLALRAFRLEHGTYPATLNELVPTYLKRVPVDPFALSGALRYRRTGKAFVLYSVGPDGKDDGGKPIFDPSMSTPTAITSGGNPRRVEEGGAGDVVAGVNTL